MWGGREEGSLRLRSPACYFDDDPDFGAAPGAGPLGGGLSADTGLDDDA
jgi:hypothetical protein